MRLVLSGFIGGCVLAALYGTQALYDGDWHQWSAQIGPNAAVRQEFVLPAGWQPPAGGRAELRLYLAGTREPASEAVIQVNGREVADLGPAFADAGPLRFWAQIMVGARNQGKGRAEVPQWYAVPVDPAALAAGRVAVEVRNRPPEGEAAGAKNALRVWGDYAPRPGQRVYEGPAVYSRIQGQDEAFLKYLATGEYGLWRWTALSGQAHAAYVPSSNGAAEADDLSALPGRQTGEYRIRLLVFAANGDLAAIF